MEGLDARTLACPESASTPTPDQHGAEYLDDEVWVDVIVANLEGEVTEWVTDLHDEGIPELADLDAFFCGLRTQFRDPMQA